MESWGKELLTVALLSQHTTDTESGFWDCRIEFAAPNS